jgi:hypothetical protein
MSAVWGDRILQSYSIRPENPCWATAGGRLPNAADVLRLFIWLGSAERLKSTIFVYFQLISSIFNLFQGAKLLNSHWKLTKKHDSKIIGIFKWRSDFTFST